MSRPTLMSSLIVFLALFVFRANKTEAGHLPIDTVKAVALYASCPHVPDNIGPYPTIIGHRLPSWYADIFDASQRLSLPRYLQEISNFQFGLEVFPTGRNEEYCFVSTVNAVDSLGGVFGVRHQKRDF